MYICFFPFTQLKQLCKFFSTPFGGHWNIIVTSCDNRTQSICVIFSPSVYYCNSQVINSIQTTEKTRSSAIAAIADRTACSILMLFIVIATSRPLNKKNLFPVSPWIQQLPRICVRNPQCAHLCCTCSRTVYGTVTARCVSLLTNKPCLFDSHAHV